MFGWPSTTTAISTLTITKMNTNIDSNTSSASRSIATEIDQSQSIGHSNHLILILTADRLAVSTFQQNFKAYSF